MKIQILSQIPERRFGERLAFWSERTQRGRLARVARYRAHLRRLCIDRAAIERKWFVDVEVFHDRQLQGITINPLEGVVRLDFGGGGWGPKRGRIDAIEFTGVTSVDMALGRPQESLEYSCAEILRWRPRRRIALYLRPECWSHRPRCLMIEYETVRAVPV